MSARTRRWVPVAACVAALGYSAMKVVLALQGELGLPGFPAPPRPDVDPLAAQLGNAALGALGAVLALAALRRWPRGVRIALGVALGAAALFVATTAQVIVDRVR